jgi:GNAT superfamily N-acetyltransferase
MDPDRHLRREEATASTPDLEAVFARMFVEIFPEDRHFEGFVRQRIQNSLQPNAKARTHQWVVFHQQHPVGFRLFSYLKSYNFGVSGYIGVTGSARGQGIGRWIHEQTLQQIIKDATEAGQPAPAGFCGEVDHPDAAGTFAERRIRERRVQIFKRLGAVVMDIDYREPQMVSGMPVDDEAALKASEADRMLFYIVPSSRDHPDFHAPNGQPSQSLVADMLRGMLLDTYGLDENDPFLQRPLEFIQKKGIQYI